MKCNNCGTENMDSMAFCTVCGTALAAANSVVPPQAPPAPVQDVVPDTATVSAPTAVADPPVNEVPQITAPGPMQGPPMGPGPMQGPSMGPGPMQGPPMAPPPPPILECGQCKKPFGPDEPFCTNCGAPRQMAIVRPVQTAKPSKGLKTALIIIIGIVVLIGAAFGIYAIIRESNYNKAFDEMNAENYSVAYETFENLGDYKDSAYYADECYKYMKYYEAIDLMEDGQYLEAKEIFDEIEDFEDSYFLGQDCLDYIEYDKAIELYNAGEYYEAYKIFYDLGYFKDSADWADKCVQPTPSSGVIEKGSAYEEGAATYTIVNDSLMYNACFLIYTEADGYWGMVFVERWDDTSIMIAPGTYYMNLVYAYSFANWFGISDMFGDEGAETPLYLDGERLFEVTSGGGIIWGSGY